MRYLLHQNIDFHAQQQPEKIAFKSAGQVITYSKLGKETSSLAALLHHYGVKKTDRVGIFMPRGLQTASAIYGILKAGAVYVPIDPKAPKERIQFLIKDCDIKVLITNAKASKKLVGILPMSQLKAVIGVETELAEQSIDWEAAVVFNESYKSNIAVLDQDLAYILYTSGSTGVPKGIMHTHYSGMNYAKLTASRYDIGIDDVIGNHAPIYFDISTLGFFTGPYAGSTTVIATDAEVLFARSLAQLLITENITVWYSVPLAIIQMMESGGLEESNLASLRLLIYAGEPYAPDKLRAFMSEFAHVKVSNHYGPTETNVCTIYDLLSLPEGEASIPIGTCWENTEYLILDEENRSCEQGQKGELLIRSATNMLGYWNNEKLTQASHYTIEVVTGLTKKYYRTGDLVIQDEKGIMHFHGRKDRQIKLRGFRIELSEIENKAISLQSITEACSFVQQNETDKKLALAVLITKDEEISEVNLKRELKQLLPQYAVPDDIYIEKSFPRTPTGKIDRNTLIKTINAR